VTLALALLAAGSGSRMRGRDKLLETVQGVALLRHLARQALAAGLGPVAVTLRSDAPARVAVLEGLGVTLLPVADADAGMSASLKVAADWAEGLNTMGLSAEGLSAEGLMICPADMPELTTQDFITLADAFDPDGPPLRACAQDGTPGHPVLFPARLLGAFSALTGDRGAQPVLHRHPPRLIPLPGNRATTDLDTPEDWADWRSRQTKAP
jgi:molybdenum cofactor cytidylyltransferase